MTRYLDVLSGLHNSSIESIILEKGTTAICKYEFSGIRSLKSVSIPDSVGVIDGYAFLNCENLTAVKIPDNLKCLEKNAFSGCTNLQSVEISEKTIRRLKLHISSDYYFRGTKLVSNGQCEKCGGKLIGLFKKNICKVCWKKYKL